MTRWEENLFSMKKLIIGIVFIVLIVLAIAVPANSFHALFTMQIESVKELPNGNYEIKLLTMDDDGGTYTIISTKKYKINIWVDCIADIWKDSDGTLIIEQVWIAGYHNYIDSKGGAK